MHAHHFLRLDRHHSPVVCGQRYETNSRRYEDPKEDETVSPVCWEKKLFFQCDNTRLHTNAATSVAIEGIGFEVVSNPRCSLDLALPGFWLFACLKKHMTEFVSHVMS
jgi:hypothetical protein